MILTNQAGFRDGCGASCVILGQKNHLLSSFFSYKSEEYIHINKDRDILYIFIHIGIYIYIKYHDFLEGYDIRFRKKKKNSQIPNKESRLCEFQRLYQHLP